jgi:hypothetical protein
MRKQLRERMMMSIRVMMSMVTAMRSASRWSVSPDTGPLWLMLRSDAAPACFLYVNKKPESS